MNYVIELIKNDQDSYEPLVEISRLLSNNNVELRQLTNLKNLMIDSENGKINSIPFDKINESFA